jgi:ketosteroid isomerase-like protein
MSQTTNVEIAKRVTGAFNRRGVDALLHLATPDSVMSSQPWMRVKTFVDVRALNASMRCSEKAGRSFARSLRSTAISVTKCSCSVVNTGRGKGSGVTVDARTAAILDFHNGRVSRIRLYLDPGEALRPAGLAE